MQEPHAAPDPAIIPLSPIAENSEIIRPVFSLPHFGQAIGASASDIARRASKLVLQSIHLYSYSGMISTPFPVLLIYSVFYRRSPLSSRTLTWCIIPTNSEDRDFAGKVARKIPVSQFIEMIRE